MPPKASLASAPFPVGVGVALPMDKVRVLGSWVCALALAQAARQVLAWGQTRQSRTLYAANVHMVMEAHDDPAFQEMLNGADLLVADGMPLSWAMRLQGVAQERVSGPALMLETCRLASLNGVTVGLYGSTPAVLHKLQAALQKQFPSLGINYVYSPPFRPLTLTEEKEILENIRVSGVGILFMGLGCPKQERCMARWRGHVPAVMLGVGAAFEFHAGTLRQAPLWMQRAGLEWSFRLAQEPRRLWKRYLKHNPRFVALLLLQFLGWKRKI